MSGRVKKKEKPKPSDSTLITGISGSISPFSQIGVWYRERLKLFGIIHQFDIPDITELKFQQSTEVLSAHKRGTGYVTAEYEEDPAVVLIRKIVDNLELGGSPYVKMMGLDGVVFPAEEKPALSKIILATDRFILQQISEVDEERLGPRYTFGNPMTYGIGRSARVYTYGGWLVDNVKDGSAQAQWLVAYNKYLRGSKCIQNNCFAEIYYRNKIRQGYLMHTNLAEDSSQPSRAQFAFTMFVIREWTTSVQRLATYRRTRILNENLPPQQYESGDLWSEGTAPIPT